MDRLTIVLIILGVILVVSIIGLVISVRKELKG